MPQKPPRFDLQPSRESLVVIGLTVVGAVVRLWTPSRLGLVHFDEGIYALAGLWSFSPRGLADIDPTVISYAPAAFPVLVGLSYLMLGVNDLAAILVSTCAGILSIPVVAWLARRNYGPGAGGGAATFAALSGPHVAFSRMALTDTTYLLFWLVALALGQRFLERPNLARRLLLGCAVGVAQLCKYNGWIAGAVILLCAAVDSAWRRPHGQARLMAATWGWGLAAALVAAALYWPWFSFVDAHGGYGRLLAHQRSYLGGLSSWPGHFWVQLGQSEFLSGGPLWLAGTGVIAAVVTAVSTGNLTPGSLIRPRGLLQLSALAAVCVIPGFSWWLAPIGIIVASMRRTGPETRSGQVLLIAWVILLVLTPFYHPYARLWLPIEAIGWLIMGSVFVGLQSSVELAGRNAKWTWRMTSDPLPWVASFGIVFGAITLGFQLNNPRMNLLGPSDSLRTAARSVLSGLPKDMKELRVYVRPPLVFYLALTGGVSVRRQPDVAHLLEPGNSTSRALLDLALLRQENILEQEVKRLLAGWAVDREIPTTLSAPTLLDIDPAAAWGDKIDASAPVWLLRPVRMEDVR